MGITTTLIPPKKREIKPKYPYLGKNKITRLIVFIFAESEGIVLIPDDEHREAEYLDTLDEDCFKFYEGEITLSND